jgi:hypothetical protein
MGVLLWRAARSDARTTLSCPRHTTRWTSPDDRDPLNLAHPMSHVFDIRRPAVFADNCYCVVYRWAEGVASPLHFACAVGSNC